MFNRSHVYPRYNREHLLPITQVMFQRVPRRGIQKTRTIIPCHTSRSSPYANRHSRRALLLTQRCDHRPQVVPNFITFFGHSPRRRLNGIFAARRNITPNRIQPRILLSRQCPHVFPITSNHTYQHDRYRHIFRQSCINRKVNLRFRTPGLYRR